MKAAGDVLEVPVAVKNLIKHNQTRFGTHFFMGQRMLENKLYIQAIFNDATYLSKARRADWKNAGLAASDIADDADFWLGPKHSPSVECHPMTWHAVTARSLSRMTSYDVSNNICHVVSRMTSYDAASNICQALVVGVT